MASLVLVAAGVQAEPLDGTRILEMEAEKARQIEDLEYQAKLIEQKAKLAKAYKDLRENGGVIPGDDMFEAPAQTAEPVTENQPARAADINQLPVLKSIGNGYALFEHRGKLFRAVPGGSLPGGFKVLSVSNESGVRIKQGNDIFSLDIAWATAK